MDELDNTLDSIRSQYTDETILDRLGVFDKSFIVSSNEDAIKCIKHFYKFLSPKGLFLKEDMKREINDFIDFWFN